VGEGGDDGESVLTIGLLNVQCLTDLKSVEVARLLGERCENECRVIGLVETHEKYKRVEWMDGVEMVTEMRDMSDKKGGGLMLVKRSDDCLIMEKVESGSRDVMMSSLKMNGLEIRLLLVYLDTRDDGRNERIYQKLDEVMEDIPEGLPVCVMGDFNGHVDFLGMHETTRMEKG